MGARARLRLGAAVGAESIAAAAAVGALFAAYLAAMIALAPASADQRAAADPILRFIAADTSAVFVAAAGFAVAAVWWLRARPRAAALEAALGQALLGCAAAAAVTIAIRVFHGPHLPDFIPAEESSAPGYTLSMAAGYGEEILFRMILVPAVYLPLAERLRRPLAIAIAAAVAGLAFALLHQLGPGPSPAAYFLTRALIPGAGMTVAFLVVGPGFLIGAHGGAHLFIPLLF